MRLSLTKLKVFLSAAVTASFALLIVFPSLLPQPVRDALLALQFGPSVVRFVSSPWELLSLGFLVVLAMTLVCGRVYCSFLCPLGGLQDLLIWLWRKLGLRKSFSFRTGGSFVRNAILVVCAAGVLVGVLTPLSLLDPFSIFTRIVSAILSPIIHFILNILLLGLEEFGFHPAPGTLHGFPGHAALSAAGISLFVISMLTLWRGRIFCNTLCPVGAALAIASRCSRFRISLTEISCKSCAKCERLCPAECIDADSGSIDWRRCILCFKCIEACPSAAFVYAKTPVSKDTPVSRLRRRIIVSGAAAVGGAAAGFILRPVRSLLGEAREPEPITPPGSLGRAHFATTCVGCHLCVSACPSQIIKPALFEYGLCGFAQPTISFANGHCEYNCTLCTHTCPTGAITPLSVTEKHRTKIGQAEYLREHCVVTRYHRECGACAEVCPTLSISLVRHRGLSFPKVRARTCIGCGHCEYICPAAPKAIVVRGEFMHSLADLPPREDQLELPDGEDIFGF